MRALTISFFYHSVDKFESSQSSFNILDQVADYRYSITITRIIINDLQLINILTYTEKMTYQG